MRTDEAALLSKFAYMHWGAPGATFSFGPGCVTFKVEAVLQEDLGFLATDPVGRAVVAIRGTHSIGDLIIDLQALLMTCAIWCGKPRCHAGVQKRARSVLPQVDEFVRKNRTKQIIFTGHSLGAAVASYLYAEMIVRYRPQFRELITFGSPRWLDNDGKRAFLSLDMDGPFGGIRVVHHEDLIPRVPHPWPLPYRHIGSLLRLDDAGNVRSPFNGMVEVLHNVEADVIGESVGEHGIDGYVVACREYERRRLFFNS